MSVTRQAMPKWLGRFFHASKPIPVVIVNAGPATAYAKPTTSPCDVLRYAENGVQLSLRVPDGNTSVGSSWRSDCTIDGNGSKEQSALFSRSNHGLKVKNIGRNGAVSVGADILPKGAERVLSQGDLVRVEGVDMKYLNRQKVGIEE